MTNSAKGIILAGGSGTRLRPLTAVISTPHDLPQFRRLAEPMASSEYGRYLLEVCEK